MKTRYFFIAALLCGIMWSSHSFAQWATSGTNIYNTNTGNVGVGTTGPNAKLHINGASGSVPFRVQIAGASKLTVGSGGCYHRNFF